MKSPGRGDTVLYRRRQQAPLYLILVFVGLVLVVAGALVRDPPMRIILPAAALPSFLMAWSFCWLEVTVCDTHLRARFGPLPCFGVRVVLAQIVSAAAARSSWLDGWGVHYMPRRGWIYNLWGFDCVELKLVSGRHLRVGTDDPAGLLRALRAAGAPGGADGQAATGEVAR